MRREEKLVTKFGLLGVLALAVFACATLTPQERAGVRMTRDNNLTRECKWLGQVEASWQANNNHAEILLMKKTFAIGGNIVFIAPQPANFRLTGEAYRCPSLPGK
jgi:hypothetical protein